MELNTARIQEKLQNYGRIVTKKKKTSIGSAGVIACRPFLIKFNVEVL